MTKLEQTQVERAVKKLGKNSVVTSCVDNDGSKYIEIYAIYANNERGRGRFGHHGGGDVCYITDKGRNVVYS